MAFPGARLQLHHSIFRAYLIQIAATNGFPEQSPLLRNFVQCVSGEISPVHMVPQREYFHQIPGGRFSANFTNVVSEQLPCHPTRDGHTFFNKISTSALGSLLGSSLFGCLIAALGVGVVLYICYSCILYSSLYFLQ